MKKVIIFFIVLLLSVWIGLKLQTMSGYILISYKDLNIQTTLWLGVITIILCFIVFYIALRLFGIIFNIPKKLRKIAKIHREHKLFRKTINGLNYIIQGKWQLAQKTFKKASKKAKTNLALIDYLGAAYASEKQEQDEMSNYYIDLAKKENPKEADTIDLFAAELLIANEKWSQAKTILRDLYKRDNKCKYAIKLLMRVYLHFSDWKHLFYLLPAIQSSKILLKNDLLQLRKEIYLGLLQYYITSNIKNKTVFFWKQLPRHFKNNPKLQLPYLTYLYKSENKKDRALAEKISEHTLKKTFDENLIKFYCSIKSSNPIKQLKIAEHWLPQHENNISLLVSLGKLCQSLMLWGKAKHYLDKALILEPTQKIYYEMGLCMEKQGNKDAAYDYYRQAAISAYE